MKTRTFMAALRQRGDPAGIKVEVTGKVVDHGFVMHRPFNYSPQPPYWALSRDGWLISEPETGAYVAGGMTQKHALANLAQKVQREGGLESFRDQVRFHIKRHQAQAAAASRQGDEEKPAATKGKAKIKVAA